MSLKDMMNRVQAGLKGVPPKDQGPVGHAVEVLQAIVKASKENGTYENISMKSIDVLLDYTENVKKALEVSVDLVNVFEDQGEWTPEKAKLITALIAKFKLAAVRARLHQYVPEKRAEPIQKEEGQA